MINKKKKYFLVVVTLVMVLFVSVAYASTVHAVSKQVTASDSFFVYGYVSITENAIIRPYNSTAKLTGSGAVSSAIFVYNGLGKDNYTSLESGQTVLYGEKYSKSGSTVKKYNNMKIMDAQSTTDGNEYMNISAYY